MAGSKITGADDLAKALRELGGAIGAPANAAVRKALQPMLRAARANAPVDDGDLKKSLAIRAAKRRPSNPVSTFQLGPRKDYKSDTGQPQRTGHLAEFGRADGSMKGTRFLTRAFEETADKTIQILGDEIGPQIEKAAARKAARRAKR